MSSGFVRIAAGTLLSGAVFVGASATPAFAAEGDGARDSNSSLPQNVNINRPQINIGANIAIAANEGDGNANDNANDNAGDDSTNAGNDNTNTGNDNTNTGNDNTNTGNDNTNKCDDNANADDANANADEGEDNATAVAVQEQNQANVNI